MGRRFTSVDQHLDARGQAIETLRTL